jgi:hypothetical protein
VTAIYVPGTEERDLKKVIMSLQQIASRVTNIEGDIGEYVSSTVLSGSAISLTTNTVANITSISVPAGSHDLVGSVIFLPAATTNIVNIFGSVSATSATLDVTPGSVDTINFGSSGIVTGNNGLTASTIPIRVTPATTTTYYLVAKSSFTVSTMQAYGIIRASRAIVS